MSLKSRICILLLFLLLIIFNASYIKLDLYSGTKNRQPTSMYNKNESGYKQLHKLSKTQYSKCCYENIYQYYQNFLKTEPPTYLQNYKNPCWNEHCHTQHHSKIKCLPYFYLAGFPKCGTTDLFFEMTKHEDIIPSTAKEPHWWTRIRFKRWNLQKYMQYFAEATAQIIQTQDKNNFHYTITGEGSASTLWDITHTQYEENKNKTEPKVILAHEIYHMTPQAKIILILRNPTLRLYSDYLAFTKKGKHPKLFHDIVEKDISYMQRCIITFSERACSYNYNNGKMMTSLYKGMYIIFIEDWLKVYPKEQVYILRLEDYTKNKLAELNNIFNFLGVSNVPSNSSVFENNGKKNKKRKADIKLGYMLPKTKILLDDFYRTYNTRLSHFLNNDKFLWITE